MISKENFFSHNLIKSFVFNLYENLNKLPKEIQTQHITEIESHLYEIAMEKAEEGINIEEIPHKVLKEFPSPKQLANEILAEYDNEFYNEGDKSNFQNFKYAVILSLFGLSGLIAPLIRNSLDISAMLPGIIASIIGTTWILIGKFNWNKEILKFYKNILKFRNVIIGIAIGIFTIQIIKHDTITTFLISYLLFYLIVCIIYFQILRYIKKRKSGTISS